MADSLRNIASIGAGVAGFLVGGAFGNPALGFAIGTVLFNVLVPPKAPDTGGLGTTSNADRETAVDTPIFRIYGQCTRDGGDLIRCAKDAQGFRTGLTVVTEKQKAGGGGSGNAGSQQTVTKEYTYLNASFCIAGPNTFIDTVIELGGNEGTKVVVDRNTELIDRGNWDEGITYHFDDLVHNSGHRWRCIQDNVSEDANEPEKGVDYEEFWVLSDTDALIQLTPIFGAVTGREVGAVSDKLRLYWGTEEQPVDSAEQEWYDDGVSADKGICKAVFVMYGPLQAGTGFRYYLRNLDTNKREVITMRLGEVGIEVTRVYLRSIPADATFYGYKVTGIEPARRLPEEIAASEFHDLHFMPVPHDDGGLAACAFTDISRPNPSIVVIGDDEMGAYPNTGGGGSPVSSSAINLQSGESRPRTLVVNFDNKDKNGKNDSVWAVWPEATGQSQTVSTSAVSDANTMGDFAEITMREFQASDGTTDVSLMPKYTYICPGVVLSVPERTEKEPDGRRFLRVIKQQIGSEGYLTCTCAKYSFATYNASIPYIPITPEPKPQPVIPATPAVIWLDGVSILDKMADQPTPLVVGYAPTGADYRGVTVQTDTGAFEAVDLPVQGVTGLTVGVFSFDYLDAAGVNSNDDFVLRVSLDNGALASVSIEEMIGGANRFWVNGVYLGAATATPVVGLPRTYDLKDIYIGLYGSDNDGTWEIPDGSRVVLIAGSTGQQHPSVVAVPWKKSWLSREVAYEMISDYDSSKVVDATVTIAGLTLKALAVSPWIVKGKDVDDEEHYGYLVRFSGRSRYPENVENYWLAGLPYVQSDPLNWTVRLLDGVDIVDTRTFNSATSEITVHYTEAELIDIFGAVPATLTGNIIQNGTYGPGFTRAFTNI